MERCREGGASSSAARPSGAGHLVQGHGQSTFQTGAPRQVGRRVSRGLSGLVVSAASGRGEGGRPPRVALEKVGGSSKGPGEGVEEPARGVAVRLPRTWSSAPATGFPVCDEPG